ncbi:MAG TPA: tRNA (adenosine(37)-N6)-dimethylallyltransferase MiaA [Candidatus Kapabacteria bacterium]|jgi:tRNA dimethylallyltransferase|nr:tRNA (adenosine(37)-N6)-dimethylallyltransferase MiaA [Candidatus Kapabacteria bacterium]HOV92415.1 tRNA (adenosine(37)-N6)-dimethylallyltransferase MiaA [Candidatus Kapabacteria bacterium]
MGRIKLKELRNQNVLPVILGPTASGKTEFSLRLAEIYDCEIISADSRQIYRYMDIGTSKPDKSILASIPHHFIDILNPDENYSAGKFEHYGRIVIEAIRSRDHIPIVVGGTGLYIKALCEGLFNFSDSEQDPGIRKKLENELNKIGREAFYEKLKAIDPISAENYSDKNPRRVIRALEFYENTGIPFSEAQNNGHSQEIQYDCLYFGISMERINLYKRISERCENMWGNGLIEETSKLLSMGYSKYLNSMNTIGYKEAIRYLEGELNYDEGLELFKKNTRHFAKRQLTWFRKNEKIQWIDAKYDINLNLFS